MLNNVMYYDTNLLHISSTTMCGATKSTNPSAYYRINQPPTSSCYEHQDKAAGQRADNIILTR